MISPTNERVAHHTKSNINSEIEANTENNVKRVAADGAAAIERRLQELNEEWDVERALETNAATVILIGSALGAFVDRRFFLLPAVVGAFLLQHALQGWCPPLAVFRRMGVRTAGEIGLERHALKALRGDFADTQSHGQEPDAARALAAAKI